MTRTTLDASWVRAWGPLAQQAIAAAKDELTELDRQIGDADHGINMDRGFTAAVAKLSEGSTSAAGGAEDVSTVLALVASTLMATVGGAAGPLYGTALLRAARVAGRPEIDAAGYVTMLEATWEGIEARGHATAGEKTMIDAWKAAAEAAATALETTNDVVEIARVAAEAAQAGAEATIPMLATKGRASYLGEQSIGHMDPGARSTALILLAAYQAAVVTT